MAHSSSVQIDLPTLDDWEDSKELKASQASAASHADSDDAPHLKRQASAPVPSLNDNVRRRHQAVNIQSPHNRTQSLAVDSDHLGSVKHHKGPRRADSMYELKEEQGIERENSERSHNFSLPHSSFVSMAAHLQRPRTAHAKELERERSIAMGQNVKQARLRQTEHELHSMTFTRSNLRKLFRRYDTDRNQALTFEEFTKCLDELNFSVENKGALRNVFRTLDVNRGGSITEAEFVGAFKKINASKLQEMLQKESEEDSGVRVRVIDYGPAHGQFRRKTVKTASLLDFLDGKIGEQPDWLADPETVRWIDVVGYSVGVCTAIRNHLNIHPTAMEDVGVSQRNRQTTIPKGDEEHPENKKNYLSRSDSLSRADSIRRQASSRTNPLSSIDGHTSAKSDSQQRVDPNNAHFQLITHLQWLDNVPISELTGPIRDFVLTKSYTRPQLVTDQIVMFIVGNNTLVTFHKSAAIANNILDDSIKKGKQRQGQIHASFSLGGMSEAICSCSCAKRFYESVVPQFLKSTPTHSEAAGIRQMANEASAAESRNDAQSSVGPLPTPHHATAESLSRSLATCDLVEQEVTVKLASEILSDGSQRTHAGMALLAHTEKLGWAAMKAIKGECVIATIHPGGPADEAGLRAGDVIVAVDGMDTGKSAALVQAIRLCSPGQELRMRIQRAAKLRAKRDSPAHDALTVLQEANKNNDSSSSSDEEREDDLDYRAHRIFSPVVKDLQTRDWTDLRAKGARFLAYRVLAEIVDFNWRIRDDVQDWWETLDEEVDDDPLNYHLNHIFDLTELIGVIKGGLASDMLVDLVRQHGENGTQFFADEIIFFADVGTSATQLHSSLDHLSTQVSNTLEKYKTRSADKMNKVLYILTVVTTVFVPGQFLTGLYGMNFETMPELGWTYSYLMFWIGILVVTVLVLYFFRRFRYFSV